MATALTSRVPGTSFLDTLLRQIAVKIQLSPTNYGIAVDHYEAVDLFLAREKSLIRHVYDGLYPQGSMAIGATSCGTGSALPRSYPPQVKNWSRRGATFLQIGFCGTSPHRTIRSTRRRTHLSNGNYA
jgi:hypothetical protein